MSTEMSPLRSRSRALASHDTEDDEHGEESEDDGAAGYGAVLDDERHEDDAGGHPDEHEHQARDVERLEVRLGAHVPEIAAHHEVVDDADDEPGRAHGEGRVPADLDRDQGGRDLRDGRPDVHRHVVHRERAVDPGGIALVQLGDEVGRVRLEHTTAHGHDGQCREEQLRMAGNREPDVSEGEDQRPEHRRAAAAQELVADPAADRGHRVGHRGERTEGEVGAVIGVAELLHHEQHDHGRHAVVAEPLPHLDEEERGESLRPRRRLRAGGHVRIPRYVKCRGA